MSENGAGAKSSKCDIAQKIKVIQALIIQNPVPLDELRSLALSSDGGFISNDLRQVIWPKLLGLNRFERRPPFQNYVARNQWSDQISRDVARSLWHYRLPQAKKRKRGGRRRLLADMMNALMAKDSTLHYYQGLHDVFSVFVLVLTEDPDLCFAVAERVALFFMGDFTRRSDFSVLIPLLDLLIPLIEAFDADVGSCLRACGLHAYVCLPWVIAWWAHDCHDLAMIARLFDAFLSAPPLFPIYLAAALILEGKSDLFALESRDFSAVHRFLSRLPSQPDLPVEAILARAHGMLQAFPPAKLVQSQGSPFLRELARSREVHGLNFPPPWYQREALPDWILLENRRRRDKRVVRSKHTRERRRQAHLAGVSMPAPPAKSPPEGPRTFGDRFWTYVSPSASFASTLVACAALVGCMAVILKLSERKPTGSTS